MALGELGNPKYIALETFRKNGQGVNTPVWPVAEDGKLYVWTQADSWKVKRIRNNSQVKIAISDMRGTPKGDWHDAQARIIDDSIEEQKMRKRLAGKYGWQYRLFSFMSSLRGQAEEHTVIEIS